MKIKTKSTRNNSVTIEKNYINTLENGYQILNIITVIINNYPIGCVALKC
jgi:hypothetical protein